MALQDTDLLVVNRGGTNYKVTLAEFKEATSVGNVIYGVVSLGSDITVTHDAVDLSKSYIVLTMGSRFDGNSGAAGVGAWIPDRTTTSFLVRPVAGVTTGTASYFLIY